MKGRTFSPAKLLLAVCFASTKEVGGGEWVGVRDRNFVYASCFSFPPPSFLALMARVAEGVWRLFQRLFATLFQ